MNAIEAAARERFIYEAGSYLAEEHQLKKARTAATKIAEIAAKHFQAWQPIETAPRGRKAILVWCPANYCQYSAYWQEDHWASFGGNRGLPEEPTHWQPLPPPPAGWVEQDESESRRQLQRESDAIGHVIRERLTK